jgi:lysophospholipase L1-like esterase
VPSVLIVLLTWQSAHSRRAQAREPGRPTGRELYRVDGLHLNDKGYELWAGLLKPHLH